jgi:hypothetical protein
MLDLTQIQNRASLALPEPNHDNFCSVSKSGNKVKRTRSVNLQRALTLNMARVSYIKDSPLRSFS